MHVIPVIDLKQGQVVHAKHGQRALYQPINSVLSASSESFSIIEGLLKLYPFQTIYIADIDAITGTGNHTELIEIICEQYPHVLWWVDNGISNVNARLLVAPQANIRAVIGSENIHTLRDYCAISYAIENRHVLSLDILDNHPLGIGDLHKTSLYWPDNIIGMTLNSVGSNNGPDFSHLKQLVQLNLPQKKPANIFAAGGVRNLADCLQLKQLGMTGVLIATALHSGKITAPQISTL